MDENDELSSKGPHETRGFWHWVHKLVPLLVIALAVWLLYLLLKGFDFKEAVNGARMVSTTGLLCAVGLTVLNYLILVGYDWAAIRYVQHPLKLGRIAFASFICYAMSHNFGWIIGGPASRYRMYSTAGLTKIEIVKLVAILAVAYWTGFFALSGIVFVASPTVLPPEVEIHDQVVDLSWASGGSARALGVMFLLGVAGYLAMTAWWKTPLRWRGHEFKFPPFKLSLFMVTTATLDIAVAASVLYAVLPPEMGVSFLVCVSTYAMAMVVVITLHMPGGYGVFETIVIAILIPIEPSVDTADTFTRNELFGILFVYRAIYYFFPLGVALLALIGHEIWLLRHGGRVPSTTAKRKDESPEG